MNVISPPKPRPSGLPSVAYAIDPRFPGGTSSAVAKELRAVAKLADLRVYGFSSRMFSGDAIAPQLADALAETGLELVWDPVKIAADIVILHNPAFLKFQTEFPVRILARRLIVVTHENFVRPGGGEAFDVETCLSQIDRACLSLEKIVAPVSAYNRTTVDRWFAGSGQRSGWASLPENWFNICDFEMLQPTATPGDLRGRLSRPGHEKFPSMDDMQLCFPKTAARNVLLGADNLIGVAADNPHWEIIPFQGMAVDRFFETIDFMVYFVSPAWRESFGRVLAEGIAAGKVVISDKETASAFADAVVVATPAQVSETIARFVEQPEQYREQVMRGQKALEKFSASAFQEFFQAEVLHSVELSHDTC